MLVAAVFYIVKLICRIPLDTLRDSGWVFAAPSSSNPWYHFYTLYDFSAVNWPALADTVPAMFALTFFGVLHVPINVPALGISTGEDNLNVDRELIAHGITNVLSGLAGSIQVVIIVVTMGAWDFVIGIFVGIVLACVNFVVQTSRKSAIRAVYSGEFAGSTVRRPPVQQRFLRDAGRQTLIIKLSGFLFFGTIVKVENTVRGLIEDEAFSRRPIRFLVLDFSRVNGLDFSAAEALTRINRILAKRNVQAIISGLDVEGDVGRSLQNVGLFEDANPVQIFEDLNSALEFCENEYLKIFYNGKEALSKRINERAQFVDVPTGQGQGPTLATDTFGNSPRRHYLQQLALNTLQEDETAVRIPPKWMTYRQPLPLLLQMFRDMTSKNEDFWFPACSYFTRETYPAGCILYHEGDQPTKFYLLESGMLRAEYEMPQGRYSELIVAGRPCGELPFFGGTPRTATVKVEQDCVAWCLGTEKWEELKAREPEIAQELLMVTLKLTAERMDSITSHVLTVAG
ncbi:Sulfate transporter family protein [Rasamsonia emersonii CBS 393.64]|uniref:Sulfate transporter family protein n=1 Tax=Rasamsonia emersonii (strain ATCC 16479 / CBS 393.64 / IMI 116815) TaxID=1408163 RepID=A0A0F4YHI2_RASE3|nr:Sulfate transporter family protein [Rasamsonia emersonii CBS 393.64]KKA17575.1 Sulfate transporter family protein [Rasamsonia emersonii CBS 393.64]